MSDSVDRSRWRRIETQQALTELVGEPLPAVRDKVRPALAERHIEWLAASPFCVLATADDEGNCDASPKGDPAGSLVTVLDATTIAIAERPGNRRVDGYHNVLRNPHVGLIFVVPGRGDTLRINGRAGLVDEAPFLDEMAVRGKRPILALVVDIDEVFFHCSKAFLRSKLWQPEQWHPDQLPERAQLAKELERPEAEIGDLRRHYGPRYADHLY